MSRQHAELLCLGFFAVLIAAPGPANAGAFIFSGATNGIEVITHPPGYTGQGGVLAVSVCIDPASVNAAEMVFPVQQIVATWNSLQHTTDNLALGAANDVPSGSVADFESVALHEVGHCIGLAHPNLASESGFTGNAADSTRTTTGANGSFNVSVGSDGLYGSADDPRGDDINLHWFEAGANNPFQVAATVDQTTYSIDIADLPAGDNFITNADRDVAAALGLPSVEAVMQQGTFFDEAQRQLAPDDVATLRYAMSGLDEIEGTGDDYSVSLSYAGLTTSCDIPLAFDANQTAFAQCNTGGQFIGNPANKHVRVTSADIFFNPNSVWHFTLCGDATVDAGEGCDDGGRVAGDGCSPACAVEAGWLCSGSPSLCAVDLCGDGVVDDQETCDDGGTTPGDGCDATCQREPGWLCSGSPSSCTLFCGDGVLESFESCDDANNLAGDGCSLECQVEPGWSCQGVPSICALEVCGDGVITPSETCDDGGTVPGDGCSATCTVEAGYVCSGEPSSCVGSTVPGLPAAAVWVLGAALLGSGRLGLALRRRCRRA